MNSVTFEKYFLRFQIYTDFNHSSKIALSVKALFSLIHVL